MVQIFLLLVDLFLRYMRYQKLEQFWFVDIVPCWGSLPFYIKLHIFFKIYVNIIIVKRTQTEFVKNIFSEKQHEDQKRLHIMAACGSWPFCLYCGIIAQTKCFNLKVLFHIFQVWNKTCSESFLIQLGQQTVLFHLWTKPIYWKQHHSNCSKCYDL